MSKQRREFFLWG